MTRPDNVFPLRPRAQADDRPVALSAAAQQVIEDFTRLLANVPAISEEERERRDAWLARDEWPQRLKESGIAEELDGDSRVAILMDRCRDEPAIKRVRGWYEARHPGGDKPPSGPPWLFVCGPVGVGKSTAAGWCLARSPGMYVTMTMLLADYSTWKRGFGEERNTGRFARMRRAAFLVLDEVGTETDEDLAREAMFALVNARQSKRAETLVLTNMTKPELVDAIKAGRYDKRAADRLRALALVVAVTGESLRKSVRGGGL